MKIRASLNAEKGVRFRMVQFADAKLIEKKEFSKEQYK